MNDDDLPDFMRDTSALLQRDPPTIAAVYVDTDKVDPAALKELQNAPLGKLRPLFVPGRNDNMTNTLYHLVEALSSTGAKVIVKRSMAHYRMERDTFKPPSAAKAFGLAVHARLLESATYLENIVFVPQQAPKRPSSAQRNAKKPSSATLQAIDWWDTFEATSEGKTILTHADEARVEACVAAIRKHPGARSLLEGAPEFEVSLFWIDGQYGVPCKARLDIFNHGGVVDLKTCIDASPEGFSRAIGSYLYHLSAAFYFSGCEHVLNATPRFWTFIAAESEPPHAVATYELGAASMLSGQHQCAKALAKYRDAVRTGDWHGYSDTIDVIDAPRYALRFDD